ncbi:MAG: hypothetical protein PHC52_00460 [Syntrophales bacterium]|nr:hypothetical protein [Syntrophales bacterium]
MGFLNEWEGMVFVKTELKKSHFMAAMRNLPCDPDTLIKGRLLHVIEKNSRGDCLCCVFYENEAIGLVDIDHEDVRGFVPKRAMTIVQQGFDPEAPMADLVDEAMKRLEKGEDCSGVLSAMLNQAIHGRSNQSAKDLFVNMMKGPNNEPASPTDDEPDAETP